MDLPTVICNEPGGRGAVWIKRGVVYREGGGAADGGHPGPGGALLQHLQRQLPHGAGQQPQHGAHPGGGRGEQRALLQRLLGPPRPHHLGGQVEPHAHAHAHAGTRAHTHPFKEAVFETNCTALHSRPLYHNLKTLLRVAPRTHAHTCQLAIADDQLLWLEILTLNP